MTVEWSQEEVGPDMVDAALSIIRIENVNPELKKQAVDYLKLVLQNAIEEEKKNGQKEV